MLYNRVLAQAIYNNIVSSVLHIQTHVCGEISVYKCIEFIPAGVLAVYTRDY